MSVGEAATPPANDLVEANTEDRDDGAIALSDQQDAVLHNEHDSDATDGDGDSDDEVEEPSMVVSRARRSNAGRHLSRLIAQQGEEEGEQDETLQEIFQEVAGDDEFSEDDGDDAGDFNMDSSSSEDEDANDEDDKGEKELQKAERHSRPKKRKTMQQLYRPRPPKQPRTMPSSQRAAGEEDAVTAAKARKKSERVSWIPTPDEGPTRASKRTLAVENKARVHERLKEKEELRLRTLAVMQAADKVKEARVRRELTQADRLAEAARVEAANAKSLNRWVENERIREEERKEKLAALKNRTIDGPFIRFWSGQGIWVGDKLEHIGKDVKVEEIELEVNQRKQALYQKQLKAYQKAREEREQALSEVQAEPNVSLEPLQQDHVMADAPLDATIQTGSHSPDSRDTSFPPSVVPTPGLLEGIEQWADQKEALSTAMVQMSVQPPVTTSGAVNSRNSPETVQVQAQIPQQQAQPELYAPQEPAHLVAGLAARTLLMLENYDQSHPSTTAASEAFIPAEKLSKKDRERDILLRSLFPHIAQQPASSTNISVGRGRHAHVRQPVLCEVTGKVARYRDPVTGLAYSDSYSYKCIHRLATGACQWSGLLGAFVGPSMAVSRPAKGVPDVFIRCIAEGRQV